MNMFNLDNLDNDLENKEFKLLIANRIIFYMVMV